MWKFSPFLSVRLFVVVNEISLFVNDKPLSPSRLTPLLVFCKNEDCSLREIPSITRQFIVSSSGFWIPVNYTSSLLDPSPFPTPETEFLGVGAVHLLLVLVLRIRHSVLFCQPPKKTMSRLVVTLP